MENYTIEEIGFWEKLTRLDPASLARIPLARAYLAQGDPEKALAIVEPIAQSHPYHRQAALLKSRALLVLGRKNEAARVLSEAEEWIDEMAGMLNELAGQLREVDHDTLAYTAETAAGLLTAKRQPHPYLVGRQKPPDTTSMIIEAALMVTKGEIESAISVYHDIMELDPGNEDVRAALAELTGQRPRTPEPGETMASLTPDSREVKRMVVRKLERLRDAARRRREKVRATL